MLYYRLLDYADLDSDERLLFDGAIRARANAQASYSKYKVGAAVLSKSTGSIYTGCNVERASYSQTTHAEQNCIDTMVTWESSAKISKLAFVAAPIGANVSILSAKIPETFIFDNGIPIPCAHCLQIIWENCHGDASVPIYSFYAKLGCITKVTIEDAFPFRFGPMDLGVDYSKTKQP